MLSSFQIFLYAYMFLCLFLLQDHASCLSMVVINCLNNAHSHCCHHHQRQWLGGTRGSCGTDTLRLHSSKFCDDGIIYRQSVCTKQEMKTIRNNLSEAMKRLTEERSSIALNRLGTTLARDINENPTIRILNEGSIFSLVQQVVGTTKVLELSNNIPVEVRLYERHGASMAWHKDDVLYDPPQTEVVFTVENTSDCVTMWKIGSELHTQETHPNSLLLLKAGQDGPDHCVTTLKRGRRVILKCAYVQKGAKFLGGFTSQFGPSDGKKKKKTGKAKR